MNRPPLQEAQPANAWIPEGCYQHIRYSHFSFRTLKDALTYSTKIRQVEKEHAEPGPSTALIFAREYQYKNANGQRFFLVADVPTFWAEYEKIPPQDRNFYEVIDSQVPCRMYFDIEFEKRYNRGVNGASTLRRLKTCLVSYLNQSFTALEGRMQVSKYILDLDSSTAQKFSHHLVVHLPKGHVFESNLLVGAVIESFLTKLEMSLLQPGSANSGLENSSVNASILSDRDESSMRKLYTRLKVSNSADCSASEKKWMIDTGVYNRNRNFRIYLSTKRGKRAPLLPAKLSSNVQKYGQEVVDGKASNKVFVDSLITYVPATAPILKVDGGVNSSC